MSNRLNNIIIIFIIIMLSSTFRYIKSQWEKIQITPSRIRSVSFIIKWVVLGYCSWFRYKFKSVTFTKVIWGRMTSSEITNRCWLIIYNWKELQTWARFIVCLVKTHYLICIMTYFGQHVTSGDLDLWSNFDLSFQGQQVFVSTRLDERNTIVAELCR